MVSIGMASCNLGVEGAQVVAEMAAVSRSLTQVHARFDSRTLSIRLCSHLLCACAQIDLSGNELCGIDGWGRGTYTAEGITAIADAMGVSRSLSKVIRHRFKYASAFLYSSS